jgi:TonB family protein
MITNLSTLFLAALIANGMLQIAAGVTPGTTSQQQTPNTEPATNIKQPPADSKSGPNPDFFGIYHAGDGVTPPKLILSAMPEFSEKARKKKIGGNCLVSLIVATNGTATDIHIAKSIADTVSRKERDAALGLDQQAIKAVAQYRFEPATYRGTPVPYRLNVEVSFQIW